MINIYQTLAAGESLFRTGEPANHLYCVREGVLQLVRDNVAGNLLTLRLALPGDLIGEAALLSGVHSVEAKAVSLVMVKTIERINMSVVVPNLALQLRRVTEQTISLVSGNLTTRLAEYLLFLTTTQLAERTQQGAFSFAITHDFLAQGIHTTRESLAPAFRSMRQQALVRTGYRHIELLDLNALQKLPERGLR